MPTVQKMYGQSAGEVMPAIADDYQFSIMVRLRDGLYESNARIDVRVTDREVWLCENVVLKMGEISAEQHDSVRNKIRAAVTDFLDNNLDIVETQGTVHTRRRLRLEVRFLDNDAVVASETYPVTVKPGSGREDADTLYLNSSKETIAHEFTHRILAAPDEYEDEESKREAPNRNLAYEGMENNQLERPYISLMKNSQSGMLLPRHALAIAGMLRHAVDSGGEQTRFSVAFSLDGENERESKRVRNFTANLSNPPSKEGAEFNQLDQRSFARFKSLSEKFEKVGWKFIPGEPIAFRFKNLICSYISKRDVIEEMGRAYDFFPRHPDDNFIHLLVERIGYERFREIVLPGEDQDIPDEKGGFEKKVIANITSAIIGTIAKNADASGEMIDVLNRQFGEILGILEKLGRAERELNEFLTNGPRDVS